MNANRFDFLIFDLDGTLIDSSQGIAEAVNHALTVHGEPVRTVDEITPYIGFPLKQMFDDFTDVPYEKLHLSFQEVAAHSVVNAAHPLDEVQATLERLAERGCRMGIATNKISRHISAIVDKLDWREFFPVTVGSDQVRHQKPHPEMLAHLMEQLGAVPRRTLMIGDTRNDILAAKAIGIPAAAISSPYGHPMPDTTDFKLKRFSELVPLLDSTPVTV